MSLKTSYIESYFDEILKNASCELIYNKDYELLIAVMLSAQTTDKKVNKVTEVLFKKYPSIDALADAEVKDIELIIHSIGLYKNKAKNVIGIAKSLKEKFNYHVPNELDELTSMPGVGRKTANVVLAEIYHYPVIAVDTHVERCSKRLGLAKKDDSVLIVEKKLSKLFKKENRIKIHHQFIHFGRYYCLAQNPKCHECKLCDYCLYYKKKI